MLNNIDVFFAIVTIGSVFFYLLKLDLLVKPFWNIIVKLARFIWFYRATPRSEPPPTVQNVPAHQNAVEPLEQLEKDGSAYVLTNIELRMLRAMILHKIENPKEGKTKTIYNTSGLTRGGSPEYARVSALYDTFIREDKV